MDVAWDENAGDALDQSERADAEHRVANLTGRERTFVLKLAEADAQTIRHEGKLHKVHETLDEKGWLRITTHVSFSDYDATHVIGFTLDGWNALCALLDKEGD